MQDGVSLWHKRRNSRVFMNKNAIKIVEIILSSYSVYFFLDISQAQKIKKTM